MIPIKKPHHQSALRRLLDAMTGRDRLIAEKSRLEAFLSAVPGDYCGWSRDGSVAYSAGFCSLLGIERVSSIADIQNALNLSDAAALEGVFNRLRQDNIGFQIKTKSSDNLKIFRISGQKGRDLTGRDHVDVLWIEDITIQSEQHDNLLDEHSILERKISNLHLLIDHFLWPLWQRDASLDIIWCNQAYISLIGDTAENIIQEQKEIQPASRKKKKGDTVSQTLGRSLAEKCIKSGKQEHTKLHVISNGKRLLMRIFETPISKSNITFGFAEDITEQEDLETNLLRFEATNRELLEQLRTAIGLFGRDQKLEFYNSAFSQLWGLEEQWLNSKPSLGDLMEKLREQRRLPEQVDFRRFKQGWLDMFTTLINPHEDMLYLPNGNALRMLVVPQSAGGLMMTFEDFTSRLELESSYNTLIAVQRETLDNLSEGVAVFGGDGRLKLWNPAYGRLWNMNPEDLEGQPHIIALLEKKKSFFDINQWLKQKEKLMSLALDRMMHEGRLKRIDDILIDYSTVPLPDGGVLVTFADITDSVQVENALREKNAALEAAERLKIDFLANVSYQLRTPLSAIMGFNDILDQEYFGSLNKKQKEYTGDIRTASDRLLSLINDILDLSTIEAGYLKLEKETIKLDELLMAVFDLAHDWARKENIHLTLSDLKHIGAIDADPLRIKQALINLLRNAINFTPEGGSINIGANRLQNGVEITISDSGIGIAYENQVRIFEPFERAHNGIKEPGETSGIVKNRGGAGLGLSLVKNIMSLHGGTVTLKSEPGQGTTVTLFIPFKVDLSSAPLKLNRALSLLN